MAGIPLCKDCRFFVEGKRGWGRCHRFPPQVTMPRSSVDYGTFPMTCNSNWCGEFAHTPDMHPDTRRFS